MNEKRAYKIGEFLINDEVFSNNQLSGVTNRKGIVKSLTVDLVGIDFGDGFPGHNLDGNIENNTGLWLQKRTLYHIKEGNNNYYENYEKLILELLSKGVIAVSNGEIKKSYYYVLNNNKAMVGRMLIKIKQNTGIDVKKLEGGKELYEF